MTQSKIEQLALKKLLPANLFNITAQFGHLLETYPNVPGNSGIYGNYKRNTNKLDVLFPLKEHPVHGITGLHALESYDDAGYVRRYTYSWKLSFQRWASVCIIYQLGATTLMICRIHLKSSR
ncbi:hypothetical protein [Paenibacillus rhizoplanae]|uniref:hypothetical protein n=1 Tax=Paenibacillus rhizoplanae TaxID=1917181 RepID=UPI003621C7A9